MKAMGVEWIEHKGKRILFTDHRGQGPDRMIENAERAAQLVREVPPPEMILFLTDFEGALVTAAVMARLKNLGKDVWEPRTEKLALIGIYGFRHILVTAYNRFTGASKNQKLFDNREEALDWLVS